MEIERKYLLKRECYDLIMNDIRNVPHDLIGDYYFNAYTRLRLVNGKAYITVKSSGTLERQEYEYELKEVPEIPGKLLYKYRYYYPFKGHTIEVNLYCDEANFSHRLILIETELKDKDEVIELPRWVGEEVTENPDFYNTNIFRFFQAKVV